MSSCTFNVYPISVTLSFIQHTFFRGCNVHFLDRMSGHRKSLTSGARLPQLQKCRNWKLHNDRWSGQGSSAGWEIDSICRVTIWKTMIPCSCATVHRQLLRPMYLFVVQRHIRLSQLHYRKEASNLALLCGIGTRYFTLWLERKFCLPVDR